MTACADGRRVILLQPFDRVRQRREHYLDLGEFPERAPRLSGRLRFIARQRAIRLEAESIAPLRGQLASRPGESGRRRRKGRYQSGQIGEEMPHSLTRPSVFVSQFR